MCVRPVVWEMGTDLVKPDILLAGRLALRMCIDGHVQSCVRLAIM